MWLTWLWAYFRPQWRTFKCPLCDISLRVRSRPHMMAAVHQHMTTEHPDDWSEDHMRALAFSGKLR